jgi:hypothetical protein
MYPDEDRQLWDLLGRSAAPKVSPFFARNVIRQIRAEGESPRSRTIWLPWRILVPAAAAALLTLSATIFMRNSPSRNAQPPAPIATTQNSGALASVSPKQTETLPAVSEQPLKTEPAPSDAILAQIDEQDYEVVQNLDDLMVMDETSLWDENSTL